jgi:predicted transcriptional regulator
VDGHSQPDGILLQACSTRGRRPLFGGSACLGRVILQENEVLQAVTKPKTPTLEDVLGPLAAPVLRAVLDRGAATVGEVRVAVQASERRAIAYTTVMTLMVRLCERGVLTREKRGRRFIYRPALGETDLIDELGRRAVDQVVDRYGSAAMRHFASRLTDLDPELRRRLLELAAIDE